MRNLKVSFFLKNLENREAPLVLESPLWTEELVDNTSILIF